MRLDRRRLLTLTGAAAAASTAGLAGCLGSDDDDPDEDAAIDASYADWLSLDADDELVFAYADWALLEEEADLEDELEHEMDEAEHEDSLTENEDFMLAGPVAGGVVVGIGAAFGLLGTGLTGVISTETTVGVDDDEIDDFATTVEELLYVNDAYVLAGDVDADEIRDELTAEPESEWDLKAEFEETDEIGSYVVYEPVDADERDVAVAVGADAIVVAHGDDGDAVDALRGPVEAHLGDGPTAAEADDDVAWLLSEAADGRLAFGGYGEFDDDSEDGAGDAEPEEDEFEDARGIVTSLSVADDELRGSFAGLFESMDDDTEAELEAVIGSSADEVSLEIDGERVTASATWNENVLE